MYKFPIFLFTCNNLISPDVPNKPNDLKTEAKSAASVFLRWELPNSNLSPLLAEKVQGRLINDLAAPGEWFDARTDPEELTDHHGCLVINLLAFNNYQFRVRASNTIGHGSYSDASDRVRTLAGGKFICLLIFICLCEV